MIDLNHGSGFLYDQATPPATIAASVSASIDVALVARNRSERLLSPSR